MLECSPPIKSRRESLKSRCATRIIVRCLDDESAEHVLASDVFFFFQAEDGIRDLTVTGVQTCALPISSKPRPKKSASRGSIGREPPQGAKHCPIDPRDADFFGRGLLADQPLITAARSEERRVGKECRSRWSPYH